MSPTTAEIDEALRLTKIREARQQERKVHELEADEDAWVIRAQTPLTAAPNGYSLSWWHGTDAWYPLLYSSGIVGGTDATVACWPTKRVAQNAYQLIVGPMGHRCRAQRLSEARAELAERRASR